MRLSQPDILAQPGRSVAPLIRLNERRTQTAVPVLDDAEPVVLSSGVVFADIHADPGH